jgi:hypothetical protein
MGFTSLDNLINEMTVDGKFSRIDFLKGTTGIGTVVAGRWYDMMYFAGYPANWIHGNYVQNYDFLAGTSLWTLGDANWAWTPATHVVKRTAAAGGATVSQNTQCENGVTYRVTYTLVRTAGSVTVSLGGTAGTARSASGTFIENIVCGATANAPVTFTPDATFAGTIDQVIVQRQRAFTPYTSNASWNVAQDINTGNGGDVSPDTKHMMNLGVFTQVAVGAPAVLAIFDMLGCYPQIATDSGSSQTLTQGTDYVTNGTFTGSAASWTVGAAWAYNSNAVDKNADGTSTLSQTTTIAPKAGLTYLVTYTISNMTVGGTITVGYGGGTAAARTLANGTYTEVIEATGSGDLIFTPSNTSRFTIDTVTVTFGPPRYGDGAGVRAFYSLQNANGANAANFVMSYTNAAGTAGRGLGQSVANTASAVVGHISHSGVATGNTGLHLPLQGGDTGVRTVQSAQFSAAGATANGCVNLVLCRPLATIPITTAFVATERDLLSQLPSLPRVRDGAVLGYAIFAGAVITAGTSYQGYIDLAWG